MRGIIWSFLNRCSNQVVMFAVSMVLARLLSPEDFGVIALANVTIGLVTCFTNLGLGAALIQRTEVEELDYCTFFWADAVMRLLVYIVIYMIAPFAAEYYSKSELGILIRLLALGIPFGIISSVSGLKLTRAMDFKTPSVISMVSCVVSSIVSIIMALRGYGLWTIVGQQLSVNVLATLITFCRVPWIPKFLFSWIRFRQFFSFGSKMLASDILDTFYNDIISIIIGKHFSLSSLGYFNKGQSIPQLLINSVNGPINGVSFPMLSKLQGDKVKYRAAFSRALQTSVFFCAPMMAGMIVVAKPLIMLLFGEKWIPAVPFLQIMAIVCVFSPLHYLNLNAIMAMGRSDIFLKLEVAKKITAIIIILVSIPFGLMAFIGSKILISIVSLVINAYPLKSLLNYSLWQQIKDLSHTAGGSLVMLLLLFPLQWLPLSPYLIMTLQIPLGIVIYLVWSWIFSRQLFLSNLLLLRNIFFRR